MTSPGPAGLPVQAGNETAPAAESPGASRPRPARPGNGQPGIWLHAAAFGLLLLAGAAAAVSFAAQYRLVYAARHLAAVAALEAAIPDAAALVFACLGVALALHGRRALRARLLNIASAAASVFMNLIAAAPGWRDLAVWAMPPTAYALASDTLIGVVRTGALARHRSSAGPAQDSFPVLAAAGGLALWLLRLSVAPASTLTGFRAWVVEECPVAPGRRAGRPAAAVPPALPAPAVPGADRTVQAVPRSVQAVPQVESVVPQVVPAGPQVVPAGVKTVPSLVPPTAAAAQRPGSARRPEGGGSPVSRPAGGGSRSGTKTARFLALVAEQHGPLAAVPLGSVARISAQVAPQAGLHTGSARAALRRAVLAAQNGARS
jgi:hypothetical protein